MKATHANSTLATDGERLVAFFGSEGLYAYDLNGKLLWKKDLGVLDAGLLHRAGGAVGDRQLTDPSRRRGDRAGGRAEGIVHRRVRREGRQRGVARDDATDVPTWSTPTVHEVERADAAPRERHAAQSAPTISRRARRSGSCRAAATFPVPTPVAQRRPDLRHQRARHVLAGLRDQGNGDRRHQARGKDTTSNDDDRVELSARRRLHVHAARLPRARSTSSTTTACSASTTRRPARRSISSACSSGTASAFTSSPVANDGKVYVASEDGQMIVLKAGPTYRAARRQRHGRQRARHAGALRRAPAGSHAGAGYSDRWQMRFNLQTPKSKGALIELWSLKFGV